MKLNSKRTNLEKKKTKDTFICRCLFVRWKGILKRIFIGDSKTAYNNKIFAIATGAATSSAIGPY